MDDIAQEFILLVAWVIGTFLIGASFLEVLIGTINQYEAVRCCRPRATRRHARNWAYSPSRVSAYPGLSGSW